jgi:hypothetical protein
MTFPSLQLANVNEEAGNLLARRRLQWGSEKRGVQKIVGSDVEAKIVDGDIDLTGCLLRRSLHARERGTPCRDSKG